ncbi:MAG: hypothetical protein CXT73_07705 [Methanobacteriota archaeon]|nr:MAG: hypothetical protein CXT73_07705 [Euryarchaeota archaeon]
MLNRGERGEIEAISFCFENRENTNWCTNHWGESGADGIEVIDPVTNNPIERIEEIRIAQAAYKADVKILLRRTGEMLALSIKTTNAAPPTVLNHTHRAANAFQQILQEILPHLDTSLDYYREERRNGRYGEDVYLNDLLNNFPEEVRNAWIRTIVYFTFEGTGRGRSICPANSMLLWDGEDIHFSDCRTQEQKERYVNDLLNQNLYRISLRRKAMPKRITARHLPWVYEDRTGDEIRYKGSLHIRLLN